MCKKLLNEELNGIELYFDEIPSAETREILKSAGFRWHKVKKCWYAKKSELTEKIAQELSNEEITAANIKKSVVKTSKIAPLWDRCQVSEIPEHDKHLTTKEIAEQTRKHIKERFPEIKFSCRIGSGGWAAHNEVNFYNCSARRMREILNRILTRDLISHEVRLDFNSILPVPDAKSSAEAWNSCSNARELKIFPKAITFVTDDGVPAPVIDALAAMFPDVDITYNWSELFTSGFCGAYKYHNGVRSFEEKHQFLRTRISVPAKLNYEGNIYELCFAPENTGLDRNDMTALAIHTLNSALKNTTYTGRLKAHELASAYEEAVKSVELMPDLGYYNPNPRSYSVLRRDR